jgi:N-formylglutamate deformylase
VPGRDKVLKLDRPAGGAGCLVADSPHSGRDYPDDFGYGCTLGELRKAEDAFLDDLYDFLPDIGIPFLQAQFPRSYVDPNRQDTVTQKYTAQGEQEYHPSQDDMLREKCTPRSAQNVYARKLSLSEVFNRVASYYAPYHQELKELLDETRAREGRAVHLNCHSMPSVLRQGGAPNEHDVIIGTLDGSTCAPEIAEELRRLFEEKGYSVGMNVPGFRGREIIRRSGDPASGRHSLQIEINRALYMDEENIELLPKAAILKADLKEIMGSFAAYCEALPPFLPRVIHPVQETPPPAP